MTDFRSIDEASELYPGHRNFVSEVVFCRQWVQDVPRLHKMMVKHLNEIRAIANNQLNSEKWGEERAVTWFRREQLRCARHYKALRDRIKGKRTLPKFPKE